MSLASRLMSDRPEAPKISGTIELRQNPRSEGPIPATLRLSTTKAIQIALSDLSVTGFRAVWANQVEKDDVLWLRLPDLAPLQARVIWSDHKSLGCEFMNPLHPAVLSAIMSKSRR